MLDRFIMPQNRCAHSIQQAQIESLRTRSKQEDQQVSWPFNRTMLHQENQSKFTVKTDHLQWGHDGDTATSSVSDIDEEIICFEDTQRNNTNNHTCSQNLSSRNSGIGVCPSHLDTHGTPEVLTR